MATLYDLAQRYLNQGLPSISGIFGPTTTTPVTTSPVVDEGIASIIEPTMSQTISQGGDGFSVYNPDPNRTRTQSNYNSRPAYEAAFGTMMGDPEANIATGALNSSGVMGDYREKTPSGLETLLGTAVDFIPGIGTIKRGAEFLGNVLDPMLPVNRRAILENELLGQGVMLDDIGRIVSNDYNTAEGIMSGYNAAKLTDESFNKRQNTIANTLSEKYGVDISSLSDEEIENFDINNPAFNLVNRYGLIDQSKNLFNRNKIATDTITAYQEEQKEKVRQEKAREAEAARIRNTYKQQQQQIKDSGGYAEDGGGGSRRGDSDIGDSQRGGYATDDTAGFF